MQITVGAQCWDGVRSKSLIEQVTQTQIIEPAERFMSKLMRGAKRLNDPRVRAIFGFGVPIVLFTRALQSKVYAAMAEPEAVTAAAMSADTKVKIMQAFDPLINLIQSLAYPIAGVMIAGGCLMIMVQQRERGMAMLQNAAIGYILVQLSPTILKLLVEVGAGV